MPDALSAQSDDPPELCAAARIAGGGGDEVRLERLWHKGAKQEVLRFSRSGDPSELASPFLSETELLGLLDAALREDVLSRFFVRQLTALIARAEQPG